MLVRDVMTSPPVTVGEDSTIKQAARALDAASITAAPVVDRHGSVVGVVSEADLIRELLPPDSRSRMVPREAAERTVARLVADVMTRMPVAVDPADDLAVAVELLTSTTVKSLPVIEHGRLLGVLSRRDVLRVLARDDARIEAEVNELYRADDTDWWATVRDGVVDVFGPETAAEHHVAEVLARSVPGVVAISRR